MTTATATIARFDDEIQIKHEDGRDDLLRYRCTHCGHKGRWMKNGAMVNMYLRRHQGDSMERTPCPKIR
jgi:hypothetical protein